MNSRQDKIESLSISKFLGVRFRQLEKQLSLEVEQVVREAAMRGRTS
jgi:hypothetical protein